jgi:dienelactone hydrolase
MLFTSFQPSSDDLDLQILREEAHPHARLLFLSYFSHKIGPFPLRVSAILALPHSVSAPLPGLLHLHGGAQCADPTVALAWAAKGYAALCIDWSVPAGIPTAPHPTRWPAHFPNVGVFDLPSEDCAVNHIVIATRRAITLLQRQPEVDPSRIAMCGISWGGLMTWLVNGSDTRLRAAVPVYGCGLDATRCPPPAWRKHFNPIQHAATQHAPVFHLNGTHDFFGKLADAEALLRRLKVPAHRLYVPNEDHGLNESARRAVARWLEATLAGTSLPQPRLGRAFQGTLHQAQGPLTECIWRSRPHSGGALPAEGHLYGTAHYPDGFACSTPIRVATDSRRPRPSRILFDPARDGLDPLYLRWDYQNLQIHRQADAQLAIYPDGIGCDSPQPGLTLFLRCTPHPRAIGIVLHASNPLPVNVELEIGTHIHPRLHFPAGTIHFRFDFANFQHPQDIPLTSRDLRVLRLRLLSAPPKPAPLRLGRIDWILG